MSEQQTPETDNLAEEFRSLGKNLAEVLRAVWESPERKNFQQEIETGLDELGSTLDKEIKSFRESPTGQRLKADVEDLAQRVQSGEAQARVRAELLAALRTANDELRRATESWQESGGTGEAQASPGSSEGE